MSVTVAVRRAPRALQVWMLGLLIVSNVLVAAPFAYIPTLNGKVAVIDLETRAVVATPSVGIAAYSVAASRSTGKVFVASQLGADSLVRLDVRTHTVDRVYAMGGPVNVIAVTPDGSRVYAVMYNASLVKVVDVATGALTSIPIPAYTMGGGIAVSPDGSKVLVVHTNSGAISVIDTATNAVVHTIGSRDNPQTVAFSPDGSRAYVSMWGANQLQVINMSTYADGSVGVGGQPTGVAVSADGTRVYTTNWSAGTVSVIDGTSNGWITNIGVGAQPLGVSTTVDGTAVYVTLASGNVVRVDAATHTVTDTIPVGGMPYAVGIFTTDVTTPSPPVIESVTGDIGSATVAFTPSINNGGSAILRYKLNCGSFSADTLTSPVTLTGMSNGVNYPCSMYAVNAVGNSVLSNTVNVRPGRVPTAPTITFVVPGDRRITVHWDAPASDGGAAISSYRLYCTGPSGTNSVSAAASPITVTSLVNGTTYECLVRAFNAVGNGALSTTVYSIPRTVPDAPLILEARGEFQVAYIRFQAPANNGAAITSYIGRCDGGFSTTVDAAQGELRITGLNNGQTYDCRVHAVNVAGESLASTTQSIVPAGPPDAPTLDSAVGIDAGATLSFTAPANTNGAPITQYEASCNTVTASGTTSPITVGGLDNGVLYGCAVYAINAGGRSLPSNLIDVTPATVPSAPNLTWVQEDNGLLRLHFQPPASNGGAPITSYLGDCGGITDSNAVSPVVVDGLSNGTPYSCTLRARNRVGEGAASTATSGTPRTLPGAPVIGNATPGNQQASIAFSPPASDGGAAISDYILSCTPGVADIVGAISPQQVTGLSNGIVHHCSVRARNVAGDGPSSDRVSVIPGTGGNVADLSISMSNNATFISGGMRTGYLITVSNAGPGHAARVRVIDELEDYFSQAAWSCVARNNAACAASGQGDLDTLLDLPAGSSVLIDLNALLAPFPEDPVSNIAAVEVSAPTTDPNLANNIASDGPDIRGVFRDGFE